MTRTIKHGATGPRSTWRYRCRSSWCRQERKRKILAKRGRAETAIDET